MLRHQFFLLFVCLVLLVTAYDASAKTRSDDAATSIKSAKTVKSAKLSQKEPIKVSEKYGAVDSAKKSSKKRGMRSPARYKSAKSKNPHNRKYESAHRDPASLPVVEDDFAETPSSVLTALSAIPADGRLSSLFGVRRYSGKTKHAHMHTGIDISAERGSPVFAAASGVVSFVGRWSNYGRIVEITHGNGLVTRYAHLDSYAAVEGARVASGEQIGTIGRSGRTTGANLHFETLVNGRPVNPMMAEMWRQTPEQLAVKRGMYVSELLHSASKRLY